MISKFINGFEDAVGRTLVWANETPSDPRLIKRYETKRPIQVFDLCQMISAPITRKESVVNRSQKIT